MDRCFDLTCIVCDDVNYLTLASRFFEINQIYNKVTPFPSEEAALSFLRKYFRENTPATPFNLLLDINLNTKKLSGFMDEFCKIKNTSLDPVEVSIVLSGLHPQDRQLIEHYNNLSDFSIKSLSLKEVRQKVQQLD